MLLIIALLLLVPGVARNLFRLIGTLILLALLLCLLGGLSY